MIMKTLTDVTAQDLYVNDVIYIASMSMFGIVKYTEEEGLHALLRIPDDKPELQEVLKDSGVTMAYMIEDGKTYEKVIEEDV